MNSKSEENNPRRLMMRCNTGWVGRFVTAMVLMAAVTFMVGQAQAQLINVDFNTDPDAYLQARTGADC
jgi:hypothetical protein